MKEKVFIIQIVFPFSLVKSKKFLVIMESLYAAPYICFFFHGFSWRVFKRETKNRSFFLFNFCDLITFLIRRLEIF